MLGLFLGGLVTVLSINGNNVFHSLMDDRQFSFSVTQVAFVNKTIPQSIEPCLPKGKHYKSLKLEAETIYQKEKYYLVSLIEEQPSIFENDPEPFVTQQATVISEDKNGCLVKLLPNQSLTHSMTLFMPEAVARELALRHWQNEIKKAGGKEQLLQSYNEMPRDAADSPWLFFPEDAWAFEQLGMKLPQPSKVGISWEALGYEVPEIPIP